LIKIPILVHKDSASSIVCVVKTIALFLNWEPYFNVFHKNLLAIGSTPVLGSSKNCMSGPPIRAHATHNFLLFPPDKFPAFVLVKASS